MSATAPARAAADTVPIEHETLRPGRAHARLRGAARRARRRGLARVGRDPALARPARARDHLHADRAGRHGRLPPPLHAPQLQDRPRGASGARRAGLDGRRGPGDRVGRHPPQAPSLLGPARRPAQPPRRPGAGMARGAARARPTRTSAGCSAARTWPTPRATPRTCSPTATCASSAAPSPVGRGRAGHSVRPRPRTERLPRGRAHRPAVGRRGPGPPPAPHDVQHQLALPRLRPAALRHRTTSRATSPGWPRSPSARPGTTTTTPSRPRPATASVAASSTPAPGSSPASSAATWPGTSSGSAPDASRPRVDPLPPQTRPVERTTPRSAGRVATPSPRRGASLGDKGRPSGLASTKGPPSGEQEDGVREP